MAGWPMLSMDWMSWVTSTWRVSLMLPQVLFVQPWVPLTLFFGEGAFSLTHQTLQAFAKLVSYLTGSVMVSWYFCESVGGVGLHRPAA
jgi:hypothetical protein